MKRRARATPPKPRLRILVMMHETLVPPESIVGLSEKEIAPWKTEYDVVSALRRMGHDVHPLGLLSDLGVLRDAIDSLRPDITFNLLEEFHGVAVYDQHVVSYLELMKRRYTGCNPRGLMLAHDKALSKQILAYHRVRVPEFAVFPLGRAVRRPKPLRFPLLIKSLTAEGSVGISLASLVHDDEQLRERVAFVHQKLRTDVIAEQFIDGRELYVTVMGNERLATLPLWEMTVKNKPDDAPLIATSKVKWDAEYQKRRGIEYGEPRDLPEPLVSKIRRVCLRTYRQLSLTGYARVDLRLSATGEVWVLEANPNPDLAHDGEFAASAQAAGMGYEELLQRVLALGLSYRAAWQEEEEAATL